VVPRASNFRPLEGFFEGRCDLLGRDSWKAIIVGSETPSGTGPTRGTCMSETRHLLARARKQSSKVPFPVISSHFQPFPAICKIEE